VYPYYRTLCQPLPNLTSGQPYALPQKEKNR
jgi:hypothetical protein